MLKRTLPWSRLTPPPNKPFDLEWVCSLIANAEDYEAEQQMEMEALQSIYVEEYAEADEGFTILIKSDEHDSRLQLYVKYTPKYPEEAPIFMLNNAEDVDESFLEDMQVKLNEQIQDSLGMAMVFTLASFLKEQLEAYVEQREIMRVEMEEKRRLEEEEKEAAKYRGTPCTIENFIVWKRKFDAEMAELNKEKIKAEAAKRLKPTGKQLFEQNKELVASDVALTTEGDVAVDTSLFEGEEALLDEEFSEDEE